LASCFGCQLQITNAEQHLMDVLGQIDLQYWQLVSSEDMPDEFDVALIEGAVTTEEAAETCRRVREKAAHVMAIGACATTSGVTGMAADGLAGRAQSVYGDETPDACDVLIEPRPVSDVIEVDSEVRCCPIDPYDFVAKLQRALYGSNRTVETRTLCADCKRNETACFFAGGELCLGLVTRAGCGARCVNLGRPCNGCAGLSPEANLDSARESCEKYGVDVAAFDKALEMFNQVQLATAEEDR
jgi:coenzyme F420-reducing hydrogenase gamma subunit